MELSGLQTVQGLGAVVNVALLCAVLWFMRRLIVKVDKIDILEVQVKAMVHEMKDLGSLRERVAVLEALNKKPKRNHHHDSPS